jgi:hypothetical protein
VERLILERHRPHADRGGQLRGTLRQPDHDGVPRPAGRHPLAQITRRERDPVESQEVVDLIGVLLGAGLESSKRPNVDLSRREVLEVAGQVGGVPTAVEQPRVLLDGLGEAPREAVVLRQVEIVGERPVDRLAQTHQQAHAGRVRRDPGRRLG